MSGLAQRILERELGRWSSHPRWERRRRRLFMIAAAAVATAIVLLILLNPVDFWNRRVVWTAAIGAVVAAAGAASLTLVLGARLAGHPRLAELRRRRRAAPPRLRAWMVVAALVVGAVAPAVLSRRLDGWWALLCHLLALVPILALWLGVRLLETAKEAAPDAGAAAPPRGEEAPAAAPADEGPPAWLDDLVTWLPAGCRAAGPPHRHAGPGAAPPADRPELLDLFDGRRASVDQAAALDAVLDPARPDVLVHGEAGSGRLATAIAAAAAAALLRGDRAWVIVADAARRDAVDGRLRSMLETARLHHYLRGAPLSDRGLRAWCDGEEPLPHVIVTTPSELETLLLGRSERAGVALETLRRVATMAELIVVDQLLSFDVLPLAHLPFLLDKLRFLLAAEGAAAQVLVTTGPLVETARQVLLERVLRSRPDGPPRTVRLRRPAAPVAWTLDLEADDEDAALERLANRCVDRGLRVALDPGGAGPVASASTLPAGVRVLDPGSQAGGRIDVVLARSGGDGAARPGAAAVVVRFGRRGAGAGTAPPRVPVLPERSFDPLRLAHLWSALRFVRPGRPVPAEAFRESGLDERAAGPPPGSAIGRGAALEIDEWHAGADEPAVGTWLAAADPAPAAGPVDVWRLGDPVAAVHRAGSRLLLGRGDGAPPDPARAARLGRWRLPPGRAETGPDVDLAHLDAFRLVRDGESFLPRSLEAGEGPVRLVATPEGGRGRDRWIPVMGLRWTIPGAARAAAFRGGPADGLRLFDVQIPGDEQWTAIDAEILGLSAPDGDTTEIDPIRFRYDATLSGLVLSPASVETGRLAEALSGAIRGSWSIDDTARFRPALTAALLAALREHAPGFSILARIAAFSLPPEPAPPGTAIVWIVEPRATERIASRTLWRLLMAERDRARVIGSAREALRPVDPAAGGGAGSLRRLACLGYPGDGRLEGVPDDLAVLAKLA